MIDLDKLLELDARGKAEHFILKFIGGDTQHYKLSQCINSMIDDLCLELKALREVEKAARKVVKDIGTLIKQNYSEEVRKEVRKAFDDEILLLDALKNLDEARRE